MADRDDNNFRVRPGPNRNRGSRASSGVKSFRQQIHAAIRKNGGNPNRLGASNKSGRFNGRGRGATVVRNLPRSSNSGSRFRPRRVVVKARIVKLTRQRDARGQKMRGVASRKADMHLRYLEREGVTRDGEKGHAYSAFEDHADGQAFIERGRDDRHQFRFIVAPEDASELEDLQCFTRDLMRQMESDLETRLDWIAVDHYNTGHPHSHILLRGITEDGKVLNIAGDYIAHGIRHRASELMTLELGPQTEIDISRKLELDCNAERFTRLDRVLLLEQERCGVIDLRPGLSDSYLVKNSRLLLVERAQKLEALSLAQEVTPGCWNLKESTELTLRELGEHTMRQEKIGRALIIHQLDQQPNGRTVLRHVGALSGPVIGRVLDRGLAGDGLDGRFYAVIDGVDGRVHYVEPADPHKIDEVEHGHIVAFDPIAPVAQPRKADRNIMNMTDDDGIYRPSDHLEEINERFEQQGKDPEAFVRSHVRRLEALRRAGYVERINEDAWRVPKDFVERGMAYDTGLQGNDMKVRTLSAYDLETQVVSDGATWLDRELASFKRTELSSVGFGAEVNSARYRRAERLIEMGLARQETDGRIIIPEKTVATLERREVARVGKQMAAESGLNFTQSKAGNYVSGTLIGPINLVSGRFAMIDDGMGFQLVPWQPILEQRIGRHITGVARDDGGIEWSLGRNRGLGL